MQNSSRNNDIERLRLERKLRYLGLRDEDIIQVAKLLLSRLDGVARIDAVMLAPPSHDIRESPGVDSRIED